tara:strand:+ start:3130 stop:4020 length:891 start_codon:yes stop_codon:yes gene_type:complete
LNLNIPSIITKINCNLFVKKEVKVFIKRDDLIHNIISGNKWRKLKFNFQLAKKEGYNQILSFGGEYSNHLHALSYAANQLGFKSVGVIRGDKKKLNPTLSFCKSQNMNFHYLDRSIYRSFKYSKKTLFDLQKLFGKFYIIPEGGNNHLGVKGCQEIVTELDCDFDYICSPVGTGCTASGIISSINSNQQFIGFCAFNKTFEQHNSIVNYCNSELYSNWHLIADNHFGGFAKINSNLIKFVSQFYMDYKIKLDLIYMGKLFYSLFNLIEKGYFPSNSKIIVLHTGGLQGLEGFNFSY